MQTATRPAPSAPRLLASLTEMAWLSHLLRRSAKPIMLTVEFDRESDGRVIADIPDLPGVMAYGATEEEALQKVAALAFRVMADRLESEEVQASPDMTFQLHARECLAGR